MYLGQEKVDPHMRKIVESLGGRLTELELFVQRLKMNMEPTGTSSGTQFNSVG